MKKENIEEAYSYLNSLDYWKLPLIPKEAWMYFERKLDGKRPLLEYDRNKREESHTKFVEYIEQTYLFF